MNHRKHLAQRLVPVGVLLLFCSLFFSLIQCQITISSKRQELAEAKEQLSAQQAKNEELSRSLDDGEDAIIERIAREEGYAKPNERIWVDLSGK
ncbi:MAG: septum formation initiator family protein [Gemmiger sp.]|uniref:FtsB family cell division protein n=1 Tax=Gemmiger sp. TaxID=2049027 RepID=UPI002E78D8EF|nr:septum formation initiator family protein [Gemmiger sp.]MEE0801432.1 septum formation initiator family protein [Gemmiger sp.]